MDEAGGLWAPQRRALTAGLVLTITFVASEALAVVTVMPVVARDLGGLRLYGWVFSGFMLGSVVGIVAAGREADRRGPAAPFVAGVVLFGCGLAVATAGSYLGGHLALRLGAGANHAEQVSHLSGLGWHDLGPLAELPDRRAVRRQLGYLSLLVYRQGTEVSVLSDRCSHLGGPLHQGRIVVERGAACVACPWHGSTFVIADGTVIHGPATARQPSFETRVTADRRVELRPRP